MNDLHVKAMLAGISFGIWPLLMSKSGLPGSVASACFSVAVVAGVLPVALYNNGISIPAANWVLVALAGLVGAVGMLSFNGMLARASVQNVGTLFVLTTVIQIAVAASYQSYQNGSLPLEKTAGYSAAILATYLLLR